MVNEEKKIGRNTGYAGACTSDRQEKIGLIFLTMDYTPRFTFVPKRYEDHPFQRSSLATCLDLLRTNTR